MEKDNETKGGTKMKQATIEFVESLVAVDFNNRNEEAQYK